MKNKRKRGDIDLVLVFNRKQISLVDMRRNVESYGGEFGQMVLIPGCEESYSFHQPGLGITITTSDKKTKTLIRRFLSKMHPDRNFSKFRKKK